MIVSSLEQTMNIIKHKITFRNEYIEAIVSNQKPTEGNLAKKCVNSYC